MAREAVMSRLWEVMKHEFHEVLPPTIFFLVAFHIVVLDRILLLRQYGLSLTSVAGATVAALLVAKIVLITDKFPFVNRFPDKPLIYNVVWKTAIYVAARPCSPTTSSTSSPPGGAWAAFSRPPVTSGARWCGHTSGRSSSGSSC
jgi:hypothetical protein